MLDLYGEAEPVELYGATDSVDLPWLNQPTPAPQNLSQRIQEWLGAKEPDSGGMATDILSGRFNAGPSYGDYSQGVIQSALGKPSIAPGSDAKSAELFKTLSFLKSLESEQRTSDFRNRQFEETMRHNRATEDLMGQRLTASGNKPIPATALKMQNEGLDIIGTAGGINADMDALIRQIGEGKLNLNPVGNVVNQGLNWAGFSNEESRNYDSFLRTLQRMRNDSLRLNKGVQTEGDAVRAWDEILANINDERLVSERLQEVKALNARAADLQRLNIDNIRANYGHDPLDYSQYENRPASVGANSVPAESGGMQEGITATNPQTGEKIIFQGGQWRALNAK